MIVYDPITGRYVESVYPIISDKSKDEQIEILTNRLAVLKSDFDALKARVDWMNESQYNPVNTDIRLMRVEQAINSLNAFRDTYAINLMNSITTPSETRNESGDRNLEPQL